jgi:hypothetical protein
LHRKIKKSGQRGGRRGISALQKYKGMFYKLVLMEILYLGLTWPLLQFSLADCCKIGSS